MNDLFDVDEASLENDKALRIKELVSLIKRYQKSYYDGEGEISDAEFDKLWDELKTLDPENEVLKKVGADSGNFAKLHHVMPMGSQEKAATPEQFLAWAGKHVYDEYLVEYKLDGASLELQYEHGNLIHAVTRGDGSVGDDITANAKKMNGVLPALVDSDFITIDYTGGIRGEVIMTHDVHAEKFSDKANCRNAANGLMKRKDGDGCEYLKLITYDAWSTSGTQPFSDEEGKIKWLEKLGFSVCPLFIAKNPKEVIDYRARVMEERKNLDYDIDGLVVKERKIDHADASRNRPDRQIAFKFSLEEAVSTLKNVEWSINGGTYTPVAVFDEVALNGTMVQRASLANPDTMRALGVKIGCKVVVVKRGEIIPKIESVIHEQEENEIPVKMPEKCECCGTKLVDEGSRLFCPNKSCEKRVLHQLMKWNSVVDIRDLGETLVNELFKSGKVKSITDLYSLTEEDLTPFFLNESSIANEKKSLGAQKVVKSIQAKRELPLSVFVAGFDIEGIGETTVEKLVAAGFNSLEKLLEMTKDECARIYGFAETMANIAVEGLAENKEEMLYLAKNVIKIKEIGGGILAGKSFCFTGELFSMKRADAEAFVKENGGTCKSSVTKDLSYLVTNDKESGSSKNQKAVKFGIPVIDEKQFLKLIGR
ncbi:MAG: NAD-dependent DNA ligase LigA [Treponema sp.]|jgi:DNA ligase (NAD+)|nr:NAD-dependent DNA ligase LigA [Treponema sp.]